MVKLFHRWAISRKGQELYTAKQKDFEFFSKIVDHVALGEHVTQSGLKRIARIIQKMNRKKKSQFLESSDTKRHTPKSLL